MAQKILRFGGEALPKGTHTFYSKKAADGSEAEFRADVGHEVPFEEVTNAQYYVDTKRASVVTGKASPAAA